MQMCKRDYIENQCDQMCVGGAHLLPDVDPFCLFLSESPCPRTMLDKPVDQRGACPGDSLGARSLDPPIDQHGAYTGRIMDISMVHAPVISAVHGALMSLLLSLARAPGNSWGAYPLACRTYCSACYFIR